MFGDNKVLSNLTSLTSLDLTATPGPSHRPHAVASLAALTNLTSLKLAGTAVHDACLGPVLESLTGTLYILSPLS